MYKLIHTNSEFLPSPAGPSPEVSSPALSPDSAPVAPGSSLGEFFQGLPGQLSAWPQVFQTKVMPEMPHKDMPASLCLFTTNKKMVALGWKGFCIL